MANKNMFLEEYVFKGHQCDMVLALTSKIDNDSNASIFATTIDLFIFSILVGCKLNLRKKPSKDASKTTKIFASAFNTHANELRLAFKFAMLTANSDLDDDVKRLNRTFRNPETDENYQLLEEYMLGGLEEIYNNIFVDSNNRYEDYLTSVNKFMSTFDEKKSDDGDKPSTEEFEF